MPTSIELTPQFAPLHMQAECVLPGEKPFAPVLAQSGSMLVAGGPRAIAIFALQDRPAVLKTLTTRRGDGIAGFCVNHSELYFQDGPVLVAYSLTDERVYAAHNLSTHQTWSPEAGETAGPPDEFYVYSNDDAPLRAKLTAARNRLAWATVLEEFEKDGAAGIVPANAAETADRVRGLLEIEGTAEHVVAETRADFERTVKSVSKVVYSAPVVRKQQSEGSAGAMLFALGLDGTVYAMDIGLRSVTAVNRDIAPLRAELALGEWKEGSSAYSCSLYYVTEEGGIAVLDATKPDLDQRKGWTGKGKPNADKVLPLSCHGKQLMGGGILGADFFVTDVDPSSPLSQTVAAPSKGWASYEVDHDKKLVLLSDGTRTRLHAYGVNVVQRDRWRVRDNARPVHVAFLPTGERDAPLAVLEIDAFQSSNTPLGVRGLLANTIDVTPAFHPASYPPPAIVLDTGVIKNWENDKFPIRWIRHRPLVNRGHLYCMVRAAGPLALESGAAQPSAFPGDALAAISRQLDALTRSDMLHAAHVPAPQVVGQAADALAKFVLSADTQRALSATAEGALDQMTLRTVPVRVRIELEWAEGREGFDTGPVSVSPPEPLRNERLTLVLSPGGEREIQTDGNGVAVLDATILDAASKRCTATVHGASCHAQAQRAKAQRSARRSFTRVSVGCPPVALEPGKTPVMKIEVFACYWGRP